jgi:hypothetical protein
MLRLAVTSLALLIGSEAWSQGRPNSTTTPVLKPRAWWPRRGRSFLGQGLPYDRYVSALGFCALGETTEPCMGSTLNNPQCFIGYQCRQRFQRSG